MCTSDLVDLAITQAEVESGQTVHPTSALAALASGVTPVRQVGRAKARRWTTEDDCTLQELHGAMTDAEIAAVLGRTDVAVHLRWERDLHIPSRSKTPGLYTANQVAGILGVENHTITYWCKAGLINHRIMPGGRNIHLITDVGVKMFAVNPDNWVYFDWRRITDPHLRRLCELRQERWGDEWWDTRHVAEYHRVGVEDISRIIKNGQLRGIQTAVSKGGRHLGRAWALWFVRKSDAVKVHVRKGRNNSGVHLHFTEAAKAWALKAYWLGWSYRAITRSMTPKRQRPGNKFCPYSLSKYIQKWLKSA